MRKHIGNTTIYRSQKVESDPKREKMRLELSRQWQIENTKMQAKKYFQSITGQSDITEVILYLFSVNGKPPKNISIKSMVGQYELLLSRKRWIIVITKELKNKLKELDLKRYEQEESEKNAQLNKLKEARDKIFEEHSKDNDNKLQSPAVRDAIRFALKKNSEAKYLKSSLNIDTAKMDVLGSKRIEKIMHYLFAEHITNPIHDTSMDPKIRYDKLSNDVDWFEAMISEMDKALIDLNEFIESAYEYTQGSNSYIKNKGGWKIFRNKQKSENIFV